MPGTYNYTEYIDGADGVHVTLLLMVSVTSFCSVYATIV